MGRSLEIQSSPGDFGSMDSSADRVQKRIDELMGIIGVMSSQRPGQAVA
jgi:hypothetical protein